MIKCRILTFYNNLQQNGVVLHNSNKNACFTESQKKRQRGRGPERERERDPARYPVRKPAREPERKRERATEILSDSL